jgi:hypothetical protein
MEQTYKLTIDESIADKILWLLNSLQENIQIEQISNRELSQYVDDLEMREIQKDKGLIENLKNGFKDAKNGDYNIV